MKNFLNGVVLEVKVIHISLGQVLLEFFYTYRCPVLFLHDMLAPRLNDMSTYG